MSAGYQTLYRSSSSRRFHFRNRTCMELLINKRKKNSVTFQTRPFLQIPSTNYQKISKDRQAQKKRTEEKEKTNK